MSMLVVVIAVRSYPGAKAAILQALHEADGIELRLDYAPHLDLDAITALRTMCTCPIIFTLRSRAQGGQYPKTEAERVQDLHRLAALNPDYFDLEADMPTDAVMAIHTAYPQVKLICSYHNFRETPVDLMALFESLHHPDFHAYKLACFAQSGLDALRMLDFMQSLSASQHVSGFCMGEDGVSTRILSPVVGGFMNYCHLASAEAIAPGQMTTTALLTQYHYRNLNRDTKFYALLGDPVEKSVGHIAHNQAITILQKNAVYIKLRIPAALLPQAIAWCRSLNFQGLSVTMPLKEAIVPLLDKLDDEVTLIQAVNTVVRDQKQFVGKNTDGLGAMQALSTAVDISKQTILLLGAGGAARAIAFTALAQGAQVIIVNRTVEKAQHLAKTLGCRAGSFSDLTQLQATVVINTLPEEAITPRLLESLQQGFKPNMVVMDVVYQPIETVLLRQAKQAQCHCVYGYDMYVFQALLQIKHWFQPQEEELEKIKARLLQQFFE
ncbi:MAG: shikimate dehydrogenase [Gammaproteobacteria bacterium]|nr:shikimate dehydrogenase [Gammaproteobacteria bacterium]